MIKVLKNKIKILISKRMKKFLDVHIVEHCNLNCKSCAHFSPLAKPSFIELNELEIMYKNILPIYKYYFKSIHLLGGEPLLHPNIENIIELTRKYFPRTEIQIVTNGIKLLSMPKSFFETCSRNQIVFYISQYPIFKRYEKICNKLEKYKIKYICSEKIEKFLNYFLDEEGKQNPIESYKKCKYGGHCIQLKNNKLYPCFQIAHIKHVNEYFGTNFEHKNGDFLDLEKKISRKEFKKFVLTSKPFCRYCNMDKMCEIKLDVSKKQREEWIIDKKKFNNF